VTKALETRSRARDRGLSRFRPSVICSLSSVLCLCGCLDTAVEMGGPQAAANRRMASPQISPRGASLAIIRVEGPPPEIEALFQSRFTDAAQNREVALANLETASYRLRGFLTASPTQGATRVAYVLDVYDRQGRRVQRLSYEAGVKAASDPWAGLDEKSLSLLAEHGAEEVADFLATTPEAIAAAGGQGGVSVVAAERAATPAAASALAASASGSNKR